MKISELNIGQGSVIVEGTIKEIGETRTFSKFGRDISVANAVLKDDSGSIKLTLWNNDIKRFKNDDIIKISNGYVNEFQGEKQLTSGKFGSIEKVSSSAKESKDDNNDSEESETNNEDSEETLF